MAADWYQPDGRPATPDEAQRLFLDIRARLLAQDVIHVATEVVVVSTWFTVIDQGPSPDGRPLLWQTAVSDLTTYASLGSYATREEAERGHAQAVALISERLRLLAPGNAREDTDEDPNADGTGGIAL
jgi:hypothetical protein